MRDSDIRLITGAKKFLKKHYKEKRHHVACLIKCKNKTYYSLHLDIKGFDICAEPIALHNVLLDKQKNFQTIVSVIQDCKKIKVVNPCGNCRQMLVNYAPDIDVIVEQGNKLGKIKAIELLPNPY